MQGALAGDRMLIAARGICKRFGPVVALDGVDFDVRAREVHALVGENGAGKSTLMLVLSGVHRPDSGRIRVRGEDVRIRNPAHARQLGVSTVFQDLSLIPALSVAENIFVNRLPARAIPGVVHWRRLNEQAAQLLDNLGVHLDPRTAVGQLSQSARQLVEIAKALSQRASVLLLDEPTSALSEAETEVLAGVTRQLRQEGLGIVLITHRLTEVLAMADRVTVLRDGQRVGTYLRPEVSRDDLVRLMVGRSVEQAARVRQAHPDEPLLEARGLRAGGVLRGVDLVVRPGEIVGVAGLDGAGRHELGLALFGALPLTGGEMRLHGQPVRWRHPADAVRAGVGYLPPDRKGGGLFARHSVTTNVVVAILKRLTRWGFFRARMAEQTADQFRRRLKIRCTSVGVPVANLSGGNQQKVLLARWLAAKPRLLVVDDPTAGIDTGAKAEVHAILTELVGQGAGVVLISSELIEMIALADRIVVLSNGVAVGEVPGADATEEAIMVLASSDVTEPAERDRVRTGGATSVG